ncbi:MAG: ABZJ_00895 family protein [Pseudomonadota bacterium]
MGRIDGQVALDALVAVFAGKAAVILLAFLLGALGIRFPGGVGSALPALLAVYWAATRLARRDRAPMTATEAWVGTGVIAATVLAIEAGFTAAALTLTGRLATVLQDPDVLRILGFSAVVVAVIAIPIIRILFPLLHQQELHTLEKKDRG